MLENRSTKYVNQHILHTLSYALINTTIIIIITCSLDGALKLNNSCVQINIKVVNPY